MSEDPRRPLAPPLSPTLASRKLQALLFIEHYFAAHGTGPSMSEIAAALNCNRSRAKDNVDKLAREGRIHRARGVPRGIRPLSAEEEAIRRVREAGWRVTKADLPRPILLDYLPANGQEESESQGEAAARQRCKAQTDDRGRAGAG